MEKQFKTDIDTSSMAGFNGFAETRRETVKHEPLLASDADFGEGRIAVALAKPNAPKLTNG